MTCDSESGAGQGTPAYSTPGWLVLADGDPAKEAARIAHQAACWRRLVSSPHCAEILAEWLEWDRRRTLRQVSHAVSGAADWRRHILSYAEIDRRRNYYATPPLTAEQVRAQARASWAELDNPKKGAA